MQISQQNSQGPLVTASNHGLLMRRGPRNARFVVGSPDLEVMAVEGWDDEKDPRGSPNFRELEGLRGGVLVYT
jgi:hypothetical protein